MKPASRQIAGDIAAAGGLSLSKLGLRFDRVATKLLDHVTSIAEDSVPAGQAVVLSISAPIRVPAKTTGALAREIGAVLLGGVGGSFVGTLNGNSVQLRLVEAPSRPPLRLVGFVHNADQDPEPLLNLAEAWLQSSD